MGREWGAFISEGVDEVGAGVMGCWGNQMRVSFGFLFVEGAEREDWMHSAPRSPYHCLLSFAVWLPWFSRPPELHAALPWHEESLSFLLAHRVWDWNLLKKNRWILDGADEAKGCAVRAISCSWDSPPMWHIPVLPWEKRHSSSAAHLRGDQSGQREGNKLVRADYPENARFSAGTFRAG